MLGRAPSTVSREVARTPAVDAVTRYDATAAALAYRDRRRRCVRRRKLQDGTRLHRMVSDRLLYWRWSPQQIAARLRRMHPEDPGLQVSHETIYAAIYAHPRGALKKAMVEALRQHKPQRGRRRQHRRHGDPRESAHPVPLRGCRRAQAAGALGGRLHQGRHNRSAVGTLVERKTRFVVLCKMDGCGAQAALDSFTRQMKKLPAFLRESLTYDRGSEMAQHEALARRLKLTIWFADPHAPWQRGSNENTNGLLRQFLPKGTDLSQAGQTQLNDIARLLNGRPRQTLDWQTPEEVMAQEIRQFRQRGALDS